MHLLFQAVSKEKEELEDVSIVFGRLAVKWQDKLLEVYPVETLNFVNLIEFFTTKEKQEEYKGLARLRSSFNQKYASTGQAPLNSRPSRANHSNVYNKRSDSRLKCSLCQGWGHSRDQCKRCTKCGKYGHPTHLCYEKGRTKKRGINATKLFEVEVGMPVFVEPVVDLTSQGKNDEPSVNVVRNKEPDTKRLLHVKSWMGASKMGVDMLVDARSAFNLISTALCKKLGLAVTPRTQTLVRFSGVSSKTVGVAEVETTLGDWSKVLQFHVSAGKVQPILGFSGLKELDMGVDCGADCLTRKDGKKLYCHAVRLKEQEQSGTAKSLCYVKVTQTCDAKGSKLVRNHNRLMISAGVHVVLGP